MTQCGVMTSLSSQSYKGTRDYYPADKRLQNYIFQVWKTVAERHGYEEYGAPLLEPVEIYAAKSGQELVGEQTYQFTDRGDRQVVIRPEMTPSISRMVAARRQELAYPARLYNIANFMRYERPQRGREREFWQLNVDIFGADSCLADVEIIQIGVDIMRAFKATDDMYTVKLNNRRVINAMMKDYLQLDPIQSELMIKLFDRKDKISDEAFRDQAIEIFGAAMAEDGLVKIKRLLEASGIEQLPVEIRDSEASKEIESIFTTLKERGISNVVFDVTLMRGFDYYTDTVFEFFDNHPENRRAMFGGGRYDGLVGLFGAEPISAVGMAPGLSMTELFLQSHGLLPEFASTTDVYIVVLGDDVVERAEKLAARLRSEGVNVELDFTGRKLDRQIKTATKKEIAFMLFVGEDDLKKELYNLKDTKTAEEEAMSFERIVARVRDRRRKKDDELLDELFA
ncbi:histidyl-tRNA synthetase [Candidatus Saccharibacteria bacterium RAAC3_TM7_1]|nr:histidyl-tRNA synthetase [Candidatus Saccharibacteria bacterium RAAC3_TM7_1]HCZ28480.1 histidine--tRNA ligase [Candidatus Saccharibacteria bacterium]